MKLKILYIKDPYNTLFERIPYNDAAVIPVSERNKNSNEMKSTSKQDTKAGGLRVFLVD